MKPGELLSQLRKNNGLSISDLCQGILPKSTYFRYIKGDVAIPYDILAALTQRLNLTLDEFTYLLQGYHAPSWMHYLDELVRAMETHEIQTIVAIAANSQKHSSQPHDSYAHIAALANLCHQALTQHPFDIPSNALVHHHLQTVSQWGLYELATCRVLILLQPSVVAQRYGPLIRTCLHRYRFYPQAENWVELLFSLLHHLFLTRSPLAQTILTDIRHWHQEHPFQSLSLRLQYRFYNEVTDYLRHPLVSIRQRLQHYQELASACDSPPLAQRLTDMLKFLSELTPN